MSRRRILVVDDEPGMLHAVRRVLEREYDVECASSPADALERFDELRPDLAILDVRMPGMDGFELVGRLKERRADVDVILMTGSVNDMDRKLVRAIREKAFYFIQKPFDREVLLTLVDRCLELRRLAEQNRRHVAWLERILDEARAFQASMLPAQGTRAGAVRVEARYQASESLSGDFYDYVLGPDGALSFLIADVAGHGASAAMLTGMVKSSFRALGFDRFEPRAMVERAHAAILPFPPNRFVTLFCGRIDAEGRRLDYVSAGHPSAVLWRAEGGPEMLDPTGPLVSPVFAEPCWRQDSMALRPGDRLLLYTDGVTETPGPEGEFGLERLQAVMRRVDGDGPGLVDAVLRELADYRCGRSQPDDVTLLLLGVA